MIKIMRLTVFASLVLFFVTNNAYSYANLLAQKKWSHTQENKKNNDEMQQVKFRYQSPEGISKSDLEYDQTNIQKIKGVRYVGVDYTKKEITVRYLKEDVVLKDIMNVLNKNKDKNNVAVTHTVVVNADIDGSFDDIRFECLHYKKAQAICEKHFSSILAADFDYENCYIVQMEINVTPDTSKDYDLHSQACIVNDKGELVKPITWLQFPKKGQQPPKLSGLLIFPKVHVLGVGLTLRLLRANGDGYDSYSIDLPDK